MALVDEKKPLGKPGIAVYFSTKTTKKDTYGCKKCPKPGIQNGWFEGSGVSSSDWPSLLVSLASFAGDLVTRVQSLGQRINPCALVTFFKGSKVFTLQGYAEVI